MRLTDLAIERNFLYNVAFAERRLQKLQDQASSGKIFSRPQDDPVGVQRSIVLRHHLAETMQFLRNLDRARSWMEHVEVGLAQITSALQRAYELAIYAASNTMPLDARQAIAEEIRQLRDEIDSIKSLKVEDKQVLIQDSPEWTVGDGVKVSAENYKTLLDDIDAYLLDLADALEDPSGDTSKIQQAIDNISGAIDAVVAKRASNGAKINRIEAVESKLQSLDIEFQRLLSNVEDVDLTEILVKLKSAEASYQAALGAGARLIQPTLLDYLR